jgi:hypothetical protein
MNGTVIPGQPPAIRDAEATLKDDVLREPTVGLRVENEATTLSFWCNTNSNSALTLTATTVAMQVSVLHDS